MSTYKLIQLGFATFGVGLTAEQAREDAAEWVDASTDLSSVPVCRSVAEVNMRCHHGAMVIVPVGVANQLGNY